MSDRERSLNPAADTRRLAIALVVLVVLGVLSWFTIDPAAVVHVHGYHSAFVDLQDRDIEVRWLPELVFGLFAFRSVLAHMRARLESGEAR